MARRLLLSALLAHALADCPDHEHPQAKYCRADFVVKAHVSESSKPPESGLRPLAISMRTQFKIPSNFHLMSDKDSTTLWVPKDSLDFKLPGKYLISGSIRNGRLESGLCDWVQAWDTVSHRHKAALRKQILDKGCGCQVTSSPRGEPRCSRSTQTSFKPGATWACHRDHSFCLPTKDGCKWSRNRELKACIQ